jgi:tetratricopeptide (TPR) repeat protein
MKSPALLFVVALLSAPPAGAEGTAGPYLAGRVASMSADYQAAATYFNQSLVADPGNSALQDSAMLAYLGLGDFDRALVIARTLDAEGYDSGLADIAVLASLARSGDFAAALAALDEGRGIGPLIDGYFRAWVTLGNGQMSDASAAFDALIAESGKASFALFQKALALALVGDFEGADDILSGREAGPINATRRSVIAHAQILSQLDRGSAGAELIDKTFGSGSRDPVIAQLRADLVAGKTVPFDLVRSPTDGIAEVFLAVGSALAAEADVADPASVTDTLLFARAAAYLRPDLTDAVLLAATMLQAQGQQALAIEAYASIPQDSHDRLEAELGRADALIEDGRTDAAIEVLERLTKDNPDQRMVWASLGDVMRRNERYGEAVAAYDRGIELLKGDDRGNWGLYYARGISHERLKAWDKAEPDFRKALSLSPDQPQVLNYLGYSYLEMKQNLDEALGMIEKAARARPDDGAISDSLGWAFYRLGRYGEAEAEMERAIQLMPADPVVNDHLGDVYWAVGRKREAEFQWKRALSFKPETEEEADRIRRKLEVGLDAVLKEEGADPLAVTTNGG